MNLFRSIVDYVKREWVGPLAQATSSIFGFTNSDSGIQVTPETALGASAVFACVAVISSTMATLPVHIQDQETGDEDDEHPLRKLLAREPNPEMTAAVFREAFFVNALLWGGAYAIVERDPKTQLPSAIWPVPSCTVRRQRYSGSGELYYLVTVAGSTYQFTPDQILDLPDMTIDGLCGVSRVDKARNAIGLGLAAEKFGGKFFSNGGNLGGILKLPTGMKDDAIKAFVASWKKNYTGVDNALKTAMLTGDMDYVRTGIDPEAAQMIDTRVFQVREVARIFRVPLHKIGDLERATFSNIEHQAIEFVQESILPWAVKFEQECNRKLLTDAEKGKIEVKLNLDALLRGDTLSRYQAHNLALMGGWQTRNEVRRKESLPPIEGGDKLLQPLNMAPIDQAAGEPPAVPAAKG